MRTLTNYEFIDKCILKFGDRFQYDSVNYVNSHINVNINCRQHGGFMMKPNNHLNGQGCPKCGKDKIKLKVCDFINRSFITHGNKYIYCLPNDIHSKSKVEIKCSNHGIFIQSIDSHLSGRGCPKCANNRRLDIDTIQSKINRVHNYRYLYPTISEGVRSTDKIEIICVKHGTFTQKLSNHLNDQGCKKCLYKNKLEIIENLKIVHNNKYNYSLLKFTNHKSYCIIICPIHGEFNQKLNNHLCGQGCPSCSGNKPLSTKEYIDKFVNTHIVKFDYSKVEYKSISDKIIIVCEKHGDFTQKASNHLYLKQGCPVCAHSKGESIIYKYLSEKNIKFECQKSFFGCIDKSILFFDFYIPEMNLCIEYDGIQHFNSVDWFGGEDGLKSTIKRDGIKNKYCFDNNINILRISYIEDVVNVLKNYEI